MNIKELKRINNNSSVQNYTPFDVSGIKERKRIANKFDIGKNQIQSSGRQTTTDVDTSQFQSTPMYQGYNNAANSYTSQIPKSIISKTTAAGLGLANLAPMYTSFTTAAHKNIAEAVARGWMTESGQVLDAGVKPLGTELGKQASARAVEKGLQSTGATVAKAGLQALGYATAAAGFGMGLADMIGTMGNYDNRIKDTDMQQGSSMSTQTKYGRTYSQYGGFDESGIMKATRAQNAADTTNMALSGVSTGLSAGFGIGSIFGGPLIGGGVGALLGGLLGGLLGDSAARDRLNKVKQDISNTKEAEYGWNVQEEATAASLGLRDMNRASSRNVTTGILNADKGKNPGQDMNKLGLGKIFTPQGITVGEQKGLASPDEGEIDMVTGETQYNGSPSFKVKDKRADIVPVGTSGKADDGYFDRNVAIPGHNKFANGFTPADLARPYFKDNEQVKDMIASVESGKGDKNTKKYMLNRLQKRYSDNSNAIANIVNVQQDMPQFSCGKNARYAGGKINWRGLYDNLNPLIGLTARLPYAIAEQTAANADKPYAQNSFVPNSTAQSALAILGSLGYDPSSDLADLIKIGRQNRYNIMNTGSLSAGQKAALSSNSNIQLGAQRRAILADAYNRNAAFKQAYANALMEHGRAEAARAQQALATQQENYRQAVGAKQRWQEQARKNWYTIAGQTLQDWSTNSYQNKMLDLWNKQADTDRLAVTGVPKKPVNTAVVAQPSPEPPFYLKRPVEQPAVTVLPFNYNQAYQQSQPVGFENGDYTKWNWNVKR